MINTLTIDAGSTIGQAYIGAARGERQVHAGYARSYEHGSIGEDTGTQ